MYKKAFKILTLLFSSLAIISCSNNSKTGNEKDYESSNSSNCNFCLTLKSKVIFMNMHSSCRDLQNVHRIQPKSAEFSITSFVNAQPLRYCNKCHYETPPEGGIQLTASKWICSKCWVDRTRHSCRK